MALASAVAQHESDARSSHELLKIQEKFFRKIPDVLRAIQEGIAPIQVSGRDLSPSANLAGTVSIPIGSPADKLSGPGSRIVERP